MKYVKMLGLAAIAAAALMALVGASTASASRLCKVNTETEMCSEANKYGSNQEIHAVLTAGKIAKLSTAFKTIECKKSTVKGKIAEEWTGSTTQTVTGPIEVLNFEECNCTVNVLKTGTLEVHADPITDEGGKVTDTDNGILTSNGAEVTVTCASIFGNVHCIYVTENTTIGTLTGGNPAELDANANIPRKPTDGLCSEEAKWTAEYEVTTPKPLYVSTG